MLEAGVECAAGDVHRALRVRALQAGQGDDGAGPHGLVAEQLEHRLAPVDQAIRLAGAKPVIVGPVTYLALGKAKDDSDKLALLPRLLPVYAELLAALAAQSFRDFEILLVDNAPEEPRPPLALPGAARILPCAEPGSYAARNLGTAAARGRILAFTDADCRPDPGWLAAFAAAPIAHSSAAELDNPAPDGTSETKASSIPPTSCPACRSAHRTPAT